MIETLIVMGRRVLRVTLDSQAEYDAAAFIGSQRQLDAIMKGHKNRGATSRKEISDETAAVGEYVASLGIKKRWLGALGNDYPDLEGGYEVKTATKSDGRLRVYPDVPEDQIHILVTPTENNLVWILQGWLRAGEAWKLVPLDDPGNRRLPIHLVPQYLLTGMDKLPNLQ